MEKLREALEQRLGRAELESRLELLRRETEGLLDEPALLSLIADEESLNRQPFTPLRDLRPGTPVFIRCTVDGIGPIREYRSSSGTGRVRKLSVSDETASLQLTLWGDETEIVERLGIAPGVTLRVLSGVFKETAFGPEIHVGRKGFIVVEQTPAARPPSPATIGGLRNLTNPGDRVTVQGVLTFFSSTGGGRARTVLARLFDGTGECEVEFSGLPPESLNGLAPGVEVELSGAFVSHDKRFPSLICTSGTTVRIVR
ncbi:MAG: hypothetical protein QW379_04760 [Thermoplasmata archaeon]